MKTFLSSCILLCCIVAFADVSTQDARDFAIRSVGILRSDKGSKKLEAFIGDAGMGTGRRIGWSETFWFSEARTGADYDLNRLNIVRVLIREPDLDDPTQVKLTDYKSAKCLVPPDKIAVVYLG